MQGAAGWAKAARRAGERSRIGLMLRMLVVTVGVLVTVAGVIFALQGFGYIAGSVMTGTTLWSVLGPLIAVGGLCIVAVGLLAPRR
jgi:hypothetical protein